MPHCLTPFVLILRYPFHGQEHQGLFAKIRRGQFSLPDSISSRARCLIRCLLRKNPEERLTTEDVLIHPWITQAKERPSKSGHGSHGSHSHGHSSSSSSSGGSRHGHSHRSSSSSSGGHGDGHGEDQAVPLMAKRRPHALDDEDDFPAKLMRVAGSTHRR